MPVSSTTLKPGDRIALKGGWRSPSIVNQQVPLAVGEIVAAIEASVPGFKPIDGYLVELAARRLVQLRLINGYVETRRSGWIDRQGRVLKCLDFYDRAEKAFITLTDRLGLSPAARARLLVGASETRRAIDATDAQRELQARYGRLPRKPVSLGTLNEAVHGDPGQGFADRPADAQPIPPQTNRQGRQLDEEAS